MSFLILNLQREEFNVYKSENKATEGKNVFLK